MAGSAEITKTNAPGEVGTVWEIETEFVFASGDTAEVKEAIGVNGVIQTIIAKCSAASGAVVTATVAIDDDGDNEIFSVAALAESTTYKYNVHEPVAGIIDVGVLPSTNPLSDYTVTVTLRGI